MHGKHLLPFHDGYDAHDLPPIGGFYEMILQYFIPLIGSFLTLEYLRIWFFPLFALAFIATVPAIIRAIIN